MLLSVLLPINLFAVKVSVNKSEQYSVKEGMNVRIVNQYGDITITVSDVDSIKIDVILTAEVDVREDSVAFFNEINHRISRNNNTIHTELFVDPKHSSNYNYVSDIRITAPAYLVWNLTNRFGNTFADSSLIILRANQEFGKFRVPSVKVPDHKVTNILFFQADVETDTIEDALINSINSIVSIKTLQKAVIKSEFSTWRINQTTEASFTTETDNISIESVEKISIKGIYSDLTIGLLNQTLETELTYGSFVLNNLAPVFEQINSNHSNVFTNFFIGDSISFNLNADVKYCDLVVEKKMMPALNTIEDGASKQINGMIGPNETDALITIIGRFENIYIKYSDN